MGYWKNTPPFTGGWFQIMVAKPFPMELTYVPLAITLNNNNYDDRTGILCNKKQTILMWWEVSST